MQALFMTQTFKDKLLSLDFPNDKKGNKEEQKEEERKEVKEVEKRHVEIEEDKAKESDMMDDEEFKTVTNQTSSSNILIETINLFKELIISEDFRVDPMKLKETLPDYLRWANEEQDTSEFLQILLDRLEFQLKEITKEVKDNV